MNFLLGILMIVIGAFMVMKTEALLSMFGRIDFFDKYLGTEGGSRLGYKFIGMLVIFIGILVMTNMIGDFMNWLLGPLLKFTLPQ